MSSARSGPHRTSHAVKVASGPYFLLWAHATNSSKDIQEELLFMTRPLRGNEPIQLAELQPLCSENGLAKQRCGWKTRTAR